jgi:hypothetical protein
MALFVEGKWFRFILSLYLVLAIAGTLVFAAADALELDERGENRLVGGDFFMTLNHNAIDWLAPQIGRAKGHGPLSARSGAPRFSLPLGMPGVQTALVQPVIKMTGKPPYPPGKNAVQIKLRI